jgi:hypothetical protein
MLQWGWAKVSIYNMTWLILNKKKKTLVLICMFLIIKLNLFIFLLEHVFYKSILQIPLHLEWLRIKIQNGPDEVARLLFLPRQHHVLEYIKMFVLKFD